MDRGRTLHRVIVRSWATFGGETVDKGRAMDGAPWS